MVNGRLAVVGLICTSVGGGAPGMFERETPTSNETYVGVGGFQIRTCQTRTIPAKGSEDPYTYSACANTDILCDEPYLRSLFSPYETSGQGSDSECFWNTALCVTNKSLPIASIILAFVGVASQIAILRSPKVGLSSALWSSAARRPHNAICRCRYYPADSTPTTYLLFRVETKMIARKHQTRDHPRLLQSCHRSWAEKTLTQSPSMHIGTGSWLSRTCWCWPNPFDANSETPLQWKSNEVIFVRIPAASNITNTHARMPARSQFRATI